MQVVEHAPGPSPVLDDTGERMIPERSDAKTFWEHVYRYRFACDHASGKRVLDIACGEGYGSLALARSGAAQVIGMDVSAEAVEHARRKYGIDARVGDAQSIDLPDGSVDLVVSFETIEHVPQPVRFLDECRRILVPGGKLIVSTPNRWVYDQLNVDNHFHCSEMYLDEFRRAVDERFSPVRLYTQVPFWAPWWSPRTTLADRSPWFAVKGPWRARDLGRRRFVPQVFGAAERELRTSGPEAILSADVSGAAWLNPYLVRDYRPELGEQPWYYIAVAERS